MTIRELKYGVGRHALIRAVIDVVAEEGLDAFSYRKVALRAGVTNTLISHHFGSKEALLEAATVWAVEKSQELANLTMAASLDSGFAKTLTRMVAEDPNLQVFQYYMILAARRSPELQRISANLYESYVGLVEHILTHYGHKPDRAGARAIFAALDGLVLQQLTVADQGEIEDAIIRLGDLIDRR